MPVSLADAGVYAPLDSRGFFPSLEGDNSSLTDPVSHQHRSLTSVRHVERVPVTAYCDGSGLVRIKNQESRIKIQEPRVGTLRFLSYLLLMHREPIRDTPDGVEVDLLVVPNATRAGVIGLHGDRVKIRVASPPEKNKANAAVVGLMRQLTGARRVEITRGRTGRHKTVLLVDVSADSARKLLG